SKYMVAKGSVALNGISLTIIDVTGTYFTVGSIPYTWKHTMLHTIKIKNRVNIETDILAKYIAKLMQKEVRE
ncbi:MAG: riboflavin synthase, partial [Candidatus Levyibacteriota bacterium]